jgi:hypothetical protein
MTWVALKSPTRLPWKLSTTLPYRVNFAQAVDYSGYVLEKKQTAQDVDLSLSCRYTHLHQPSSRNHPLDRCTSCQHARQGKFVNIVEDSKSSLVGIAPRPFLPVQYPWMTI